MQGRALPEVTVHRAAGLRGEHPREALEPAIGLALLLAEVARPRARCRGLKRLVIRVLLRAYPSYRPAS
eukprot:1631568-Pyramimonas_sp.AAC.1